MATTTIIALVLIFALSSTNTHAAKDWKKDHPKLILGVITEENAEDREIRMSPMISFPCWFHLLSRTSPR